MTDSAAAANAAIIAVGSELLSGQTVNRNAAWMSARLHDYGIPATEHVTVDDDLAQIKCALDREATRARHIFITGGLGPTSDDLTREAVASWCDAPLEYHQASWDRIVARFSRMGLPVPQTNEQQCYFPQAARVLENRAGTADAFRMDANGRVLWVLPGPPREVETLWTDYIEPELKSLVPTAEREELRRWRTIGKGESQVAELLTPILHGESVNVAYRAHAPFVETKVSFPRSQAPLFEPLCRRVQQALEPWLFEVDDEDVARDVADIVTHLDPVTVYDAATGGLVLEELAPRLRESEGDMPYIATLTTWEPVESAQEFVETYLECVENGAYFCVAGFTSHGSPGDWAVGLKLGGRVMTKAMAAPYPTPRMQRRNRKAIANLAFKGWRDLYHQLEASRKGTFRS